MSLYQWTGDVLTEWKALQDQLDKSKREWETFMHTGKTMAGSSLAPEILSSWRRCKDRGLNPYDDNMTVLSQRQLEQRLEQNELLIETIRPILQETAGSIRDSGYRIDLYDKDLYLILLLWKNVFLSGFFESRSCEIIKGDKSGNQKKKKGSKTGIGMEGRA